MVRFFSIMVVCCGVLCAGMLSAQDRRTSRPERRIQAPPGQGGQASGLARQSRPLQERRSRASERQEATSRPGARKQVPILRESQQGRQRVPAPARPLQQGRVNELFGTIQQGLANGSAASFSGNLAPQVYLNLRGGESGYYSANQVHYVLENYFKSRRLVNVKFSTIGESDASPYATGSATFVERGSRSLAQVYVSLSRSGERWIITQINIY